MAKLGVKSIRGNVSPLIGQPTFYEVHEFYPGTSIADQNAVKWNLYAMENGRLRLLDGGPTKFGKRVSFEFPQKWYGESLLIEAYVHTAERKAPPGLIIRPVQGPKKVTTLTIKDGNENTITKPPKYGEHITAIVTTENMVGDEVELEIWERDTLFSNSGHDANSNTLLWNRKFTISDRNGILKQKILLDTGMMAKANRTFDGFEHEYYLVVKSQNRRTHGTQTVNVSNSEIVLSPSQRSTPPRPQPRPASPPEEEKGMVETLTAPVVVAAKIGWDMLMDALNKPVTVNAIGSQSCEGKFCIKRGDPKSELIREINIRLAGFGGNVPTDEFTDRTEKMVKQFQRDYMKVAETGKVCGNVLKAIEDFQTKFNFNFDGIKCKCGTCSGFGDNSHKGEYLSGSAESRHRYEYPGLHRSLLWALKAVIFYLEKDGRYSLNAISSGYRCRHHEEYRKRPTTNHMGKALDLHFNKNNTRTRAVPDIETIRSDIFNKYLGAKWDWNAEKDIFYLESTRVGATTWVHYDVREFNPASYLQDKYFAKTQAEMNGQNIILLAKDAGHQNTCSCLQPSAEVTRPAVAGGCYCDRDLTSDELVHLGISRANADKFLEAINATMTEYTINTCERKLHFLAQLRHESGEFVYMQEIASGSAYEGRTDLGNTQTGDGVRFKGRGLIQITGRTNYTNYGTYKSENFTTEPNNKKLAELPYCVDSAGWYWSENLSVDLNDFADKDDIIYITYRINGGFNGYISDRKPKLINMIKKITCTKTTFENFETYSIKTSKAWDGHDAVYKYARLNTDESKDCYQRYLDLTANYLTWNISQSKKNNIATRRQVANDNN